jgi:uncharacterized Ntn-hydrolase superfamily protein
VDEQKNTVTLTGQLKDLRTLHLADIDAQKELAGRLDDMLQRIRAARTDLQAAGAAQPRIQSMSEQVLAQMNAKYELLSKAGQMITRCMQDDIDERERMFRLAEKLMLGEKGAQYEREVVRFRQKQLGDERTAEIERALRTLRDSMDMQLDLDDLLRAAEGNAPDTGSGS